MKRKVIYTGICLLLVVVFGGARMFHRYTEKNQGKLGEEIIVYNSSKVEDVEQLYGDEKETTESSVILPEKKNTQETSTVATGTAVKGKYAKITSKSKIKTYDTGTAVIGKSGYELYTYVESVASRYAKIVNSFGEKLGTDRKLYHMVVPTSAGITLPDNKVKHVNTSSQKKSLKKIEKKINQKVEFIPLYDALMQHRKEYIYFRTDHHWTAKGAYYAYEEFCRKKGITPHVLSDYKKTSAKGFLGTFYRDSNQNKSLKKDIVEMYHPVSAGISMKYTTPEGAKGSAPLIGDANRYGTSLKYCAFLAGDNAYSIIRNKKIKDGSSCLVIKESYGNAFVPYLADHYETIYVMDYRYQKGSAVDFVKKKKIKDVILLNNISMTRNTYLVGKLGQLCK